MVFGELVVRCCFDDLILIFDPSFKNFSKLMILLLPLLLYEVWYNSITIPKRKLQYHSIGIDNCYTILKKYPPFEQYNISDT